MINGINIGANKVVKKVKLTTNDIFALANKAITPEAVPPGQAPTITKPINAVKSKPKNLPII
ncbi:hypothetical protein FN3523_0341 [Francisella hispaniensis]|uniref:Uncharacterized protein n=1 Tax=Francisella hispaniensis TaxID=622488 RepID=F4BJ54_9GAMM|nr:hypothetical protein FN3523_0341 [Francisella hispaniensis]